MKKRIISLALSAITAVSAVSAMSANASPNWYWGQIDEEKIAETFEDCILLENDNWLRPVSEKNELAVYLDKGSCYVLSDLNDSIIVNISPDYDINEFIENLADIDEDLKVVTNRELKNKHLLNLSSETISPETAKKVREKLGESVIDFNYSFNQISYQTGVLSSLTRYVGCNDKEKELREYLGNSNIDVELIVRNKGEDTDGTMEVVPAKELTLTEHYKFAEGIYKELGLVCGIVYPESVTPTLGTNLDLTDYLNGDANRDKTTTIADAAAIMQAIANPDKYALSDLGEFNADFACDGLTVDDAVAIQKKLAGLK